MEHSYSRETKNAESISGTKTILYRKLQASYASVVPPLDDIDLEEAPQRTGIPPYNEEEAKLCMEDASAVSRMIRNNNPDDQEWDDRVVKYAWTSYQIKLFDKTAKLLHQDRLARLANADRAHEPVLRRCTIDKSVERLRKALAEIHWDTRLVQWLHSLLQEHLPPAYMAIYMDILQSLKIKCPSLTDKIVFGRPGNINQDFVGHVLKKPWEPPQGFKNRALPGAPFIIVAPSGPNLTPKLSSRTQQWHNLLQTMGVVVPIHVPVTTSLKSQGLQAITEQMVYLTRMKIQEIHQDSPDRPIILMGFNAGAALALQVALVEQVSCIVAFGLAYNTMNGVRGSPADHITDVTVPVLFVTGQNADRASPEEIERLREKMLVQTKLVIVGAADDALRVGKTKRQIEGVTQNMVDNMVMDEVAVFCQACLENPVRIVAKPSLLAAGGVSGFGASLSSTIVVSKKRKNENDGGDRAAKKTAGRPKAEKGVGSSKRDKFKFGSKTPTPNSTLDSSTASELEVAKSEVTPTKDLGITVLETKKLSPIPLVKTEGGVTQLEIKPAQATKQIIGSQITFQSNSAKPQVIKLVPSNQFIQLKPNTVSTPQGTRIVTLKSTPQMATLKATPNQQILKSATIAPGSKIYTLKAGPGGHQQLTQVSTSSCSSIQQPPNFSPTKFTIMKQGSGPGSASAGSDSSVTLSADSSPTTSDYSNIMDMPVLFADNDGGLQEQVQKPPTTTVIQTRPTQYIIQTKPTMGVTGKDGKTGISPGKSVVISNIIKSTPSATQVKPVSTNVMVLNKNSIRPMITSKPATSMPQLKFAKFVMTPPNAPKIIQTSQGGPSTSMGPKFISAGKKIEIINSSIIRSGSHHPITSEGQKYTPIIINVDPSKSQSFKTILKKPGEMQCGPQQVYTIGPKPQQQPSSSSNILLKSNLLKHVKPTILSRGNLTVKRVINVPPKSEPSE